MIMEDQLANRVLYFTLDKIRKLSTSKINMWDLTDRYSHPPFLRFRFEGIDRNDPIYDRLKKLIESYSGGVRWSIVDKLEIPNLILLPEVFKEYSIDSLVKRKDILQIFNENNYKRIIDESISDVPQLASYIKIHQDALG